MAGVSEIALAIDRHMGGAFAWQGEHCAAAIGRVLSDLGYAVPEGVFWGCYASREEACRLHGGSLSEIAEREAQRLGWAEVDPAGAEDADVGLKGDTLAIRCGAWWVAKTEDGYALLVCVERAWRPR